MDDSKHTSSEQGPRRPRLVRVRERLKGKAFLIPNFITVISIFCGFLSIVSTFKGNHEYACKCILLSIILDGLDGRVARRLNAMSAFGREFDSLSDLVAFGVAPAMLIYSWAFSSSVDEFGLLLSFFFVVCGATRLARFSIATEYRKHFTGLPIPGAAAAMSSLVYFSPTALSHSLVIYFICFYTVLIAVMMVSTLPYFSVKHLHFREANPRITLVVISLFVALAWYHSHLALLIGTNAYALSGFFAYLLRRFTPKGFEKLKVAMP